MSCLQPHLWLHGICHCTGIEGVKMRCCLLFQDRVFKFNPTNLLNHVAPSIELMMQMSAISILIQIISALCNNLQHLRLTR